MIAMFVVGSRGGLEFQGYFILPRGGLEFQGYFILPRGGLEEGYQARLHSAKFSI